MKISMILPIYNENSTIDGMMEQLRRLPGDWEILFADGGSTDGTVRRIGTEYPVLKSPKGRAAQMNDGAARASGEILWFVHCDSRLPEDAHSQIQAAVESGAAWGCFHIGFDYDGPFMGCNTFFSNRRARRGIAFGDQGIWIRRELFLSLGGFPELPIMEDYEFSMRMRERGIRPPVSGELSSFHHVENVPAAPDVPGWSGYQRDRRTIPGHKVTRIRFFQPWLRLFPKSSSSRWRVSRPWP